MVAIWIMTSCSLEGEETHYLLDQDGLPTRLHGLITQKTTI
jgi:hypothetical protein